MTEKAVTNETPPHVWVSLTIIGGQFDPADVTARLGVEPTSSHRVGDPVVGNKGRRRRDRWRITIGPRDTIQIDAMLAELLARMAPSHGKLRQVCTELGLTASLTCAVEPTSAQTPAIVFPPAVVKWAAANDVAIDVDIMLWREEETKQT